MRTDLSPSQQAVQACHACLELAKQAPWSGEHPHLVLLALPCERDLVHWLERAQANNLAAVPFYEPDLDNSLTAFAVANVSAPAERKFFRALPMLKLPTTELVAMTFQSKWGFHPCTVELFRKLKRLNFLAYEGKRRISAWNRWNRKDPQNRRRFVGGLNGWEKNRKNEIPKMHRSYELVPEPTRPPLDLEIIAKIAADYQNAKKPVDEACVIPLVLSESKIESLLQVLENWYAKLKPAPKAVTC